MPGMRFKSTAALPRPTVPLMLSSAETWRRLPLTRTSVWSGLRPRSVAGRSASEPSAIDGCGKLNDGTSWLRILLVSVWPVLSICVGADHVDRHRAVGDRPVGGAGAGDDDRLFVGDRIGALRIGAGPGLRLGVLLRRRTGLGQRRSGEGQCAQTGKQRGTRSVGHDSNPPVATGEQPDSSTGEGQNDARLARVCCHEWQD